MLAVYVWDAPMDFACLGDDLIFTSPICTWAMLARFLSLEELIVLGDSILRRNTVHRQYSQADFKNYLIALRAVKGRRAPRGIVKCERALTLMRPGTDSSRETKLRLCIVQHGLPMPMINHRIRAINGNVYYLDLAYLTPKSRLSTTACSIRGNGCTTVTGETQSRHPAGCSYR